MNTLYHHGILGMKWGVRRYQNEDGSLTPAGADRYGSTVKKGSKIYRVSNNPNDKTYDNKKYVSLTSQDHEKWQKYIGDSYKESGREAYNIEYEAKKDLKIADYQEVGKIFIEKHADEMMRTKMLSDTNYAAKTLGYNSDDADDLLSANFAMQTETGKMFVRELMKKGYQGVQDRHGQNTADNPVIIFDPDKNLKKKKVTKYG